MTMARPREDERLLDAGAPGVRHVGIIMDGNGRWAVSRGLPRTEGHRRGVDAVRAAIEAAVEIKLGYLTLFGFSSENWSRPRDEVDMLFGLFRTYVRREVARLDAGGVRVRIIGSREGLPADILKLIDTVEERTKDNRTLNLNFAFNYGGRDELVRAVRDLATNVASGVLAPEDIDERAIGERLDTQAMPDPDLIVRTSGEMRLSNFLLWQCAYSELVFVPKFWPDFSKEDLVQCVQACAGRARRYGGVEARGSA